MAYFLTNRCASGWVSDSLAARTDWSGWFHALRRAENVILPPQGGAKRRPVLTRVLSSIDIAASVERIFPFNKNEQEKFVIGLRPNDPDVDDDTWKAVNMVSEGAISALPEIDGELTFTDITSVKGFHYADSLLFTQLDGKQPIQRVVRETATVADARTDINVLRINNVAVTAAPNGFVAAEVDGARIRFDLAIGTNIDSFQGHRFDNANPNNVGRVGNLTTDTSGYIFEAFWREDTKRYDFVLQVASSVGFNKFIDDGITVKIVRVVGEMDATTQTVDFVTVVGSARTLARAEGLKSEYLTIKNPPVTELTTAEFNALPDSTKGGYGVQTAVPSGDADTDTGERVLEFNGTDLTARKPGLNERGYPIRTKDQAPTSYLMDWNDRDGFPAALAFRHNRLAAAGANDNGARMWFSVAGDALEYLLYTREGTESEFSTKIEQDFALSRTLDSFSKIQDLYADNGFVIFTDRDEWSIQGTFGAGGDQTATARARRYSTYGSAANVGVGNVDNQLFFVARNSAFSLIFQGDDLGYVAASDLTAKRNEDALQGRPIRLVAAQPDDLNTLKMVAILVDPEDGTNPYIAVWHTETFGGDLRAPDFQHQAWAKWTFDNHQIIDICEVDNKIYVLADRLVDGAYGDRALYVFDGSSSEMAGVAGDETGPAGGDADGVPIRSAFDIILETPEMLPIPQVGEPGLLYPKTLKRIHVTGDCFGGELDAEVMTATLQTPDGEEVIGSFDNFVVDRRPNPQRKKRVCDSVQGTDLDAQGDSDFPTTVTIKQTGMNPFRIHRIDIEATAQSPAPSNRNARTISRTPVI